MNGVDNGTSFIDECGKTVQAVSGNICTKTGVFKFAPSSAYFPGATNDGLSFTASADFLFPGDLTVDFWARFSSLPSSTFFTVNNTALKLMWASNSLSIFALADAISVAWTPIADIWYHIALVRTGGVFKVAVNGTFLSVAWSKSGSAGSDTAPLFLGSTGSGQYFNGYMDEFRMSNGIARWTKNFSPPKKSAGVWYHEDIKPVRKQLILPKGINTGR